MKSADGIELWLGSQVWTWEYSTEYSTFGASSVLVPGFFVSISLEGKYFNIMKGKTMTFSREYLKSFPQDVFADKQKALEAWKDKVMMEIESIERASQ
jgi:hypothetical protein